MCYPNLAQDQIDEFQDDPEYLEYLDEKAGEGKVTNGEKYATV